jgi:four helix bundle protein
MLNVKNMKQNIILEKSFEFSLTIIKLYQQLIEQKEYVLSKQLLRSATSIGANVNEGTAAQTKKDFISKMSIASKEARETLYWLLLLDKSQLAKADYQPFIEKAEELIRLLTAIVKTAQQNENPH